MKSTDFRYTAASDVVIVGQDGESADMTNPQGYIYSEVFFAVAISPSGECYRHDYSGDEATVERLVQRIWMASPAELSDDCWRYWRAVYGSEAHDEFELMEAEFNERTFGN